MSWRSSVAVDMDGSYRTVYSGDVQDTYDLIYANWLNVFLLRQVGLSRLGAVSGSLLTSNLITYAV